MEITIFTYINNENKNIYCKIIKYNHKISLTFLKFTYKSTKSNQKK